MILALDGSSVDGSAYTDVVHLARHAPVWLNDTVSAWSAYGLVLFAVLMTVGWWRARRMGATVSVTALAVPFVVVVAYGVDTALKLLVREDRPCQSLRVATLEACPAPGDWSFPSNHTAIAAAAAVALLFVSRRLGAVAVVAGGAMAASRVWAARTTPMTWWQGSWWALWPLSSSCRHCAGVRGPCPGGSRPPACDHC